MHILLLFGGESSEHEVSINSAKNIYAALNFEAYDVQLCFITPQGKWQLVDSIDELENGEDIVPVLGAPQFVKADGSVLTFDCLLPILHGAHGEDGDIQGLARLMHLPCVGPSLIGAAITMDKDITKRLLMNAQVPVVEWMVWHTSVPQPPYEDAAAALGQDLFIKPANAGSSVGVSKVRTADEYEAALQHASEHDSIVLIERAIQAREIEVAVLGNGADLTVSTPGEIIPGEEFYSYDDKYSSESKSRTQIPAKLSLEVTRTIQGYAKAAYLATRGQGMARIDFFLDENGAIYLNEINAIPGFTNISMYPKLLGNDGVSYGELIDRLIKLAKDVY